MNDFDRSGRRVPQRIFLSYRRDDGAWAGRVADRLIAEFGKSCLFMDVDSIPLGVDFVQSINDEVAGCNVLLAVIGKQWLEVRGDNGSRRIDNSNDYVRIEIGAALKRGIPVIPILVDGMNVPQPELLPGDIRGLAVRNGLHLRHATFHADLDRLVRDLRMGFARDANAPPEAPVGSRTDQTNHTISTENEEVALTASNAKTRIAILDTSAVSIFTWLGGWIIENIWWQLWLALTITDLPAWYAFHAISICVPLSIIVLLRNSKKHFWLKQSATVGFLGSAVTRSVHFAALSNTNGSSSLGVSIAVSLVLLTAIKLATKRRI